MRVVGVVLIVVDDDKGIIVIIIKRVFHYQSSPLSSVRFIMGSSQITFFCYMDEDFSSAFDVIRKRADEGDEINEEEEVSDRGFDRHQK